MVLNIQSITICIIITLILSPFLETYASTKCSRSCGTTKKLPFPFGFSSGCQIQLNCTTNGTIVIDEFPVQKITPEAILVYLPAKCGRPLQTLQHLFHRNYAPTAHNGILLQNCTTPVTGCMIPNTLVETHLELLDCSSSKNNNTISCYSEQNSKSLFTDYLNVMRTSCQFLLSAVSTETFANSSAVSLEVQVVQLGWWLEGTCRCSDDATCTSFRSPINGQPGYRCRCNEGFSGDGFWGGSGCRKESGCSASRYLSGHCGGITRVGMLVGGVAAGALLMVSIGLICCYCRRHSNSKAETITNDKPFEPKGISIPIYPYKEIEKATQSFSEKRRLGTGAYGTVYSGKFHDNDQWVAIKKIKPRPNINNIDQVLNEIKLLSSVSHPNLVRLLGCSSEKGEQVLVYEFMPNGTLCQHLHRDRGSGLAWPIRLMVASGTAQAIAYLHSAINPPIYHRDIKSSNILLDYDYAPKVADFGLSRFVMTESSHVSTAPQGTPGYLDPQYQQNFHLSDRSDVYSFGVVLVEIITGLKVIDFTRRRNEVNLASLAIDRIGQGRLNEIIDPFLVPNLDDSTISSMQKVAELAFRSLVFESEMRPSMTEVAAELEQIRLSISGPVDVKIPIQVTTKKTEFESEGLLAGSLSSMDKENYSPVSVQDSWLSDLSSPSSNSLLSRAIQ